MDLIMNFLDLFLAKVVWVNRWYNAARKKNEKLVTGVAVLVAFWSVLVFTTIFLLVLVGVLGLVRAYGLSHLNDD